MEWFKFIKERGFFDPSKNPDPITTKEGVLIPFWEPLNYLEKLSHQIKIGKQLNAIDEIVRVIVNVSEHPKDNYRTWYVFLKILGNLPNESIPEKVFLYLPIWFGGRFDTMLQTTELCGKLLPKFLNDNPSADDIKKSNLILRHIFALNRSITHIGSENVLSPQASSYYSRMHLYFVEREVITESNIKRIAAFHGSHLALYIANNLKLMLLDFPNGIAANTKTERGEFEIRIVIDEANLIVSAKTKTGGNSSVQTIEAYEELSEPELQDQLVYSLKRLGVVEVEKETLTRIQHNLLNDMTSVFGRYAINELGDEDNRIGEDLKNILALTLRELLSEMSVHKQSECLNILSLFILSRRFRLPYFKRLALYVVALNWRDDFKDLFWTLMSLNEPNIFSDYKFEKDLMFFLKTVSSQLTESEVEKLAAILEKGPQDEWSSENHERIDYWRLKWYSCLRENQRFVLPYQELSKKLSLTADHFQESNKVIFTSGWESPYSESELVDLSVEDIALKVNSYRTESRFGGPSIEGLARAIGNVTKTNPGKILDGIDHFINSPYTYIYHILNGFIEAWKVNVNFDWGKLLRFVKKYLNSQSFGTNSLLVDDNGWGANSDLIIGQIGNLISTGTQKDNHAFDMSHMPVAKKILLSEVPLLQANDNFKETNMDYPTYSLNSTAGKLLRGLLDFSLRTARMTYQKNDVVKWDSDVRELFEEAQAKEIIDSYIFLGMYNHQFFYLDDPWISKKVEDLYLAPSNKWQAFMGGLTFGEAPFNERVYQLMVPHYERAISEGLPAKTLHDQGISKHIGVFYLRGYEQLNNKSSLIYRMIALKDRDHVMDLITFFWRQEKYIIGTEDSNRKKWTDLIIDFWELTLNTYNVKPEDGDFKVLSHLIDLIGFVTELNERNAKLLAATIPFSNANVGIHKVVEKMVELKNQLVGPNDEGKTSLRIGQLLNCFVVNDYLTGLSQTLLIELIEYLYLNNQKVAANTFCNRLAINGLEFHKPIFLKYN